jgi:hypothetical protein
MAEFGVVGKRVAAIGMHLGAPPCRLPRHQGLPGFGRKESADRHRLVSSCSQLVRSP